MRLRKYVSGACACALALLLISCGSSSSTSTNPPPAPVTGLKKRVLVSVLTTTGIVVGEVLLLDGQKNVAAKTITVNQPTKMLTAGGQTVALESNANRVSIFNNSTEVATDSGALQGQPFDVAISPDGKNAYAAVKNSGVVQVVDTSTQNVTATITVPTVSRLVEGPNGHKLLAFSDNPAGGNTFFVIDTAANTATAISDASLDQPFTAIFDPSDTNDTTAFILNCGAECGGTSAGVVKVNFGGATPTFTPVTGPANAFTSNAIAGATVAKLSGSKLFVAGTLPNPPAGVCPANVPKCGSLQVIDTGTLTASAPVPITDGQHDVMALTSNNRLYIGATGCTVGPITPQDTVQGCLSIFDTGSAAGPTNPVFPSESSMRQNFDVTGLQPISGSNAIYVIQGGELDIFDITTNLPSTIIQQIDINGLAIGVLQIDP